MKLGYIPNMAKIMRMSISIPSELKAQMNEVKYVNWSKTARSSFERKLSEISQQNDLGDIIERLRATKQKESDAFRAGHTSGRLWAETKAEISELNNLARVCEEFERDPVHTWGWFLSCPHAVYSPAELLVFGIFGIRPELSNDEGKKFWESWLGELWKETASGEWLCGFAEGAITLWQEVRDRI